MQSLLRLTFRDAVPKSYQVTRESLEILNRDFEAPDLERGTHFRGVAWNGV